MAHTVRGWLPYVTDQGGNVSIKASLNTAINNNITLTPFPTGGAVWGYAEKDLRHVLGKDISGFHAKMVVCDPALYATLFVGVSTFTDSLGNVYTITSKIGEKSNARDAR